MVQASLGKKQDLMSKITRAKRAEGMAQAVGGQPSKYKDLSSNSSSALLPKKTRI
jgi:hypothetical protein